MSIGLYDADMMKYTIVPFNLELMKISSYYKKRGEIVIFSPQFSPERNTKFFYRKDYDDNEFPNFANIKNVEYGGLAFSQNKYIPLDLDIEKSVPDTFIYAKQEKSFINASVPYRKKIFKEMIEGEHLRLSLDGKTIWKDYPSQFKDLEKAKDIMFHDLNLAAIDGAPEEVAKIIANGRTDKLGTKLAVKFPIKTDDERELLKWIQFTPNSNLYFLEYAGVMSKEAFMDFIQNCRKEAKYTQFDYNVTAGSFSENDFVKNKLREIYHQVIISRSYRVFFSLKYDDKFFFDKTWNRVLDLFNFYQHSMRNIPTGGYLKRIADDTMINFAKKSVEFMPGYKKIDNFVPRSEMKQLFQFIKKMSPELYEDFYKCSYNSLGGKL